MPLRSVIVCVIGFAMWTHALNAKPAEANSAASARALDALMSVLKAGPSTEQIHAAEVLIMFGRADDVRAFLEPNEEQFAAKPIYRVIRWRALAGAARDESARVALVAKIMEVACTPGAPDQLHAIESATKIGARPTPAQADALELYAQTLAEHDVVFVRWLLWSAHPPKDEVGLVTHWLKSDDPVTRLRAAYIQRWLHPRQLAVRAALADAADRATEANLSTAIVVSAACLVEPDHPHRGAWLQTLKRCAASTDATQRYHALQGLMKSYDEGKLPVLVAMLDDPQPDIRIGAAWSILDIAQRRTDSLRIIKPHSP